MTPRERFLTACDHRIPDRVPIALGGTANKFYASTVEKLVDYYGLDSAETVMEPAGFKYIPFHEKLYEKLGVDVRMLYPHTSTAKMLEAQTSKGKYKTIWGSEIAYTDVDAEWAELGVGLPFAREDVTVDEILSHPWPVPEAGLADGLHKRALEIRERGDYAIGVYRPFEAGIFGITHNMLRGMVNFFLDLLENVEVAEALLDKVLEVQKAYYGVILDEVGDLVDFVETEDDLGAQDRPLISPDSYRNIIKPRHKELIRFIKSKCKNKIRVFMHSDGAIFDFIPDFIDVGVDILNPLQVGATGIDLKLIKQRFGDRLAFNGGVDVQQPFKGSKDDVKAAVRTAIDSLGGQGGYILGTTHNYPPDVSVENIVTMFDYAREYGVYK